jgi:hypothetical protein
MKRFVILAAAVGMAAVPVVAHADNPGTQRQPSQSCQAVFPGGTFSPNGFNTAGFNHATTVYAGAQSQNSSNPKSVSQYDVACFQAGQHLTR